MANDGVGFASIAATNFHLGVIGEKSAAAAMDPRIDVNRPAADRCANQVSDAGLSAARARRRKGGRPKGVMNPNKQKAALALKNDTSRSILAAETMG